MDNTIVCRWSQNQIEYKRNVECRKCQEIFIILYSSSVNQFLGYVNLCEHKIYTLFAPVLYSLIT